MKSEEQRFGLSCSLMNSMIALARKHGVEKLYLFGSRAHGNDRERSDIDLAVLGGNIAEFHDALEEETPTLLFFDVVDLSRPLTEELRKELNRDGVLIYEKV